MIKQLLPSIRATIVLAFLTSILFPMLVTAIGQMLFPFQANGSLIRDHNGVVIGSFLIGQNFTKPEYFHPRPSAAGAGYAAEASGGTNLGPTSSKLINGLADDASTKDIDETYLGIKQLAVRYREENNLGINVKVPVDAVTRSGSGLDPHISIANANLQASRVANTRGLPLAVVRRLIDQHTEGRQLGFLGEPRINVFLLNYALDQLPMLQPRKLSF